MERKGTVLVADDNTRFLMALNIRLRALGFDVIEARDGYQAVALARERKPDLILLDWMMPAGNGLTVAERIRHVPEIAGTPIAFITGAKEQDIPYDAGRVGALAVLHKPLSLAELSDVLSRFKEEMPAVPTAG